MNKILVVTMALVLALGMIAADVIPTAVLSIKNRSADLAYFTFYAVDTDLNQVASDPSLYVVLDPQTNELFDLVAGTYQIESDACGVQKVYTEEIAGRWNLTVPACPKWAKHLPALDNGLKLGLAK